MVEEARQHLHRIVLERESRSVEQFHQPEPGAQLLQRCRAGVVEAGIDLTDDSPQHLRRHGFADKRLHHPERDLRVGLPTHGAEVILGKQRPKCRHIKAAIRGKPRQQNIIERQGWRLATGADVLHGSVYPHVKTR